MSQKTVDIRFDVTAHPTMRQTAIVRVTDKGEVVEQYKFSRITTHTGKLNVRVIETTTPYYVFQSHDHEREAKEMAKVYFGARQ